MSCLGILIPYMDTHHSKWKDSNILANIENNIYYNYSTTALNIIILFVLHLVHIYLALTVCCNISLSI